MSGAGLPAIHVAHAELLSERRCDPNFSAAFHEPRIASQCCDHSPDEFGAFAIGEIEPSACGSGHNQLGSYQAGIERHHGDAVRREAREPCRPSFYPWRLSKFRRSCCQIRFCAAQRLMFTIKSALLRHHDPGGMGRGDECGTHSGVHHAGPPVGGLFPEGQGPGELAILAHALVSAPGGVDQHVQPLGYCGKTPRAVWSSRK